MRQTPPDITPKAEREACGEIIDLIPKSVDVSFFNNYLEHVLNGKRMARATQLNPAKQGGIRVSRRDIVIQNDTRTEESCAAYEQQFTVVLRELIIYGGHKHELTRAIQSDKSGNIMGRIELAELSDDGYARPKRPSDLAIRKILGKRYSDNTQRRNELIEGFGLEEMFSPYDIDNGPVGITNDPNSAEISEVLKIIACLNREGTFQQTQLTA
ncbi:hypothetical protein DYH10_04070 [Candidatus Saccharibacteria bacterium CPR2]|nr:hypothetical protein [Candidatus Saccharibacteria bacterium CPR2]